MPVYGYGCMCEGGLYEYLFLHLARTRFFNVFLREIKKLVFLKRAYRSSGYGYGWVYKNFFFRDRKVNLKEGERCKEYYSR